MIRNVVIHLHNEQPMMADLFQLPAASDTALICTNLRTMNGQRPVFIDDSASYFIFPFIHVRFVEVLPRSMADQPPGSAGDAAELPAGPIQPPSPAEPEADLEIDEDFLKRIRDI
jgi:hypothetical protein